MVSRVFHHFIVSPVLMTFGFTISPRLAPAQAILKEEERKAAAREALVEAINQRDVPSLLGIHGWDTWIPLRAVLLRLEAALREGANSGLAGEEMVAAKAALKQRYFGVEVESMSKDAVHFDTLQKTCLCCVVQHLCHSLCKDALLVAQRMVETRNDLESAVRTRDPARLGCKKRTL